MNVQPTLFDGNRMTLVEAVQHTALILNAYREDYVHWAICHVWDWLTGMVPEGYEHGFSTRLIAAVYGQDENLETHARTGCAGCNLASRDLALESIIRRPQWAHFSPLLELRALYAELKRPHRRIRKDGTETRKDGSLVGQAFGDSPTIPPAHTRSGRG